MINPDNLVRIQGRLVSDAEYVMDGKMLRMAVAIDRAGYEKGSDSNAGFFNCKMWMTENDYTASGVVKSVRSLVENGRLSKGAPVSIVGSLNQDRFTDKDDNRRSEVNVVIEAIQSFAKSSETTNQSVAAESSDPTSTAAAAAPEPF